MRVNTTDVNKHPVVLFWHMHQPDYRDGEGVFQQPWTYLHAIKDYTDMAAHLENIDGVSAVVNLPVVKLAVAAAALLTRNPFVIGVTAAALFVFGTLRLYIFQMENEQC